MGRILSLRADAQQQIAAFIAQLQQRYQSSQKDKQPTQVDLADEALVGMWKDREDLQDSSRWVWEGRTHEWK